MAISYPRTLPVHTGIRSIELRAINAVAYSQSPFTFSGQAIAYQGQRWEADVTLPPMKRSDAEQWVAWLVSLRGQFGTFLLGDPNGAVKQGTATSVAITGSAGDNSVSVSMIGSLLTGDYIQLGTGSDATLHKVLVDKVNSGTLEIWPALRKARSGVTANLASPVGKFRLASNEQAWSINEMEIYGITFGAVEAI